MITHRARRSDLADATRWRGIPITTVQRTLVDLAAVLEEDELARAVHEADVRRHTTPEQVEQVLSRRHNWPDAQKLRRVIWGDVPVTLSRLESRFLDVLRTASLPQPETNRRVDPATSIAAGPSTTSPSSSTATAITTPVTPGSRTASESAKRGPAATSSGGAPGSTSMSSRRRCSQTYDSS